MVEQRLVNNLIKDIRQTSNDVYKMIDSDSSYIDARVMYSAMRCWLLMLDSLLVEDKVSS